MYSRPRYVSSIEQFCAMYIVHDDVVRRVRARKNVNWFKYFNNFLSSLLHTVSNLLLLSSTKFSSFLCFLVPPQLLILFSSFHYFHLLFFTSFHAISSGQILSTLTWNERELNFLVVVGSYQGKDIFSHILMPNFFIHSSTLDQFNFFPFSLEETKVLRRNFYAKSEINCENYSVYVREDTHLISCIYSYNYPPTNFLPL